MLMMSARSLSEIADYLYLMSNWNVHLGAALCKETGYDPRNPDDVFSVLFRLNMTAFIHKNGKRKANEISRSGEYHYISENERKGSRYSKIELFKSLQCFLFQLEEDRLMTQNSHLFDRLLDQSNILANSIITTLPEYRKAIWG